MEEKKSILRSYDIAEVRLNEYSALYKRIQEINWDQSPLHLNSEVKSYKKAKELILQLDFKEYFADSRGKVFEFIQYEEKECDFLFLYPILLSECTEMKFKKLKRKMGVHLIEVVNQATKEQPNINSYYFVESKEYCMAHYNRTENGVYSLNFNISTDETYRGVESNKIKYVNLNIIDIIMLTYNLGFEDAIMKLCNYFDITIIDSTKQKYLDNIEILKQIEHQYPYLTKYMKTNKCQYLICFHEYAIEMSKGNTKDNHKFCFVHRNAKKTMKDTEFARWSHTNHSRVLGAFIKLGLILHAGKSNYKSKLEYESPNLYLIPAYNAEIMENAEKLAMYYKKNKVPFTELYKYNNKSY